MRQEGKESLFADVDEEDPLDAFMDGI